MDALTSWVVAYRYQIEILTIVVASITAISSIDDIFVDLYYWCLKVSGRQNAKDKALARSISETRSLPQRPFAIMVPAWHEHDVIYSMLATNSRLVAYKNYHFFVGVYRNDQATIAEVQRAQAEIGNVHIVVVPRDGPTSKADCLNQVLAAIRSFEIKTGVHFAGVALHDSEDFIHPHELDVFNSLIGTTYDFVQLPVFSFSQSFGDLVGGIYMDEFAEVHTKDLIVRRHFSGLIPCAGVSACFSRAAVVKLAEKSKGEVFHVSSFTEDYDIAFRLRSLGLRSAFVSCPVNYTIDIHRETITPTYVKRRLPIATREFFPSSMRSAYRQRARWLIGIVFQGTSSHGWEGNWGTRYFLLRDRKGIVTGPTVILGYFVLASFILIEQYLSTYDIASQFRYLLLSRETIINLFIMNLAFLIWRILHRMYFTTCIYDWQQGLMSVPRLIVANFVNFFAVVRATHVYVGHRISKKPLVWDKTAHSYPVAYHREKSPTLENAA